MSKTISAGRTPTIEIDSVGGDLSLVGWEGDDILLKTDEDELHVQQDGDRVRISCDDDLSIRVPKGANVLLASIGGDASIRGVMGQIDLKDVGGDLSMRDVNSVAIEAVHADFSLRGAKGNLSIRQAKADVSIRDVDGSVLIESVSDDLALRDVRGSVSANVGEDVVMYLNPQPGNSYTVHAGDDILLVMPPKANATLTLSADEIDVDWAEVENDEDATNRVLTLGNGAAPVTLSAGGDIRISNRSDAGDSAEDFGNFAGMGMDWSGFDERISRRVEQAASRAQRKADEVIRRAENKVRDAGRRSGKFKGGLEIGRWSWDFAPKGVPVTPRSAVSDEERLAILKMLQEKKISAEDAEKLLSALEGGS
ncbi:MAG: hypothetical protein IPG80_08340 [Anaerolineales bacterium]|jgi:hypothetical protein|uniref:SHOCT-like domain-containing protein n=1 Tax=Candidatus Villigracilis vicinus TaxID=3140679 RepID=UPI003134A2BB|nr:hypothetical protein [Anaerolineales bacterium]MBK7449519.1 hypothetical protein [Anaerolineales bacterium]MBK9780569.1 hypothetical protein [Anaerolineales bacterium]